YDKPSAAARRRRKQSARQLRANRTRSVSSSPSSIHFAFLIFTFALLDHLIRSVQHRLRNRQADLLGCFEIDNEIELLWLLHREVGGLGSFQNLIYVCGGTPEQVRIVWGVGQKPPVLHILWLSIHCRQPVLYSEICNLYSVRIEDGAHQHEGCIDVPLGCG